jgi:mRNA interferase MazF
MTRGEIYYANLDPAIGSEQAKRRPVLIVSNDANNRAADTVTVLPVTSRVDIVRSFEVLLPANKTGLKQDSKALAQQIRTISKARISARRLGQIPGELMEAVERALRIHLDLR